VARDASLRRLGLDTIDLYQVHAFDALTPLEETYRFLDDAVSAGKIRYVGLSNYLAYQLQRTVDLTEQRGWSVPVTLQPQYNLLVRDIEWDIVRPDMAGRVRDGAAVDFTTAVEPRAPGPFRAADRPGRNRFSVPTRPLKFPAGGWS